jgi:ribosomal protein L11 methyltransferase
MDWIELSVVVRTVDAEHVSNALEELAALAVTSVDAGDSPVLEPGPGETPLWPEVRVTGLFPGDSDRYLLQALLAQRLADPAEIESRVVADQDWTRAWLDDFKPMRFGSRLCICPSHHTPPEDAQVVVTLDPGLAFGTGTHPTTGLCLEWLDDHLETNSMVVDFGCGSGVLAIAALKLGARQALCIDNDPQALEATIDNAERNQVRSGIEFPATPYPQGSADIVFANILAGPLVELADVLTALVRPGGYLVLSGILADQRLMVDNAYQKDFGPFQCQEREGWVRLSAARLPK